jgi:hypothetical protein
MSNPNEHTHLEHRLFNQLMAADASKEEVEELYYDLKTIFENPFDKEIEGALMHNNSFYIEQSAQLLN